MPLVTSLALAAALTSTFRVELPAPSSLTQESKATMSLDTSVADPDLEAALSFQRIGLYKVNVTGDQLTGRSFILRVRRFDRGVQTANDIVLDSRELGPLGQVGEKGLAFRVLSQTVGEQVKFDFNFGRFSVPKVIDVPQEKREFALKHFCEGQTMEFKTNEEVTFLAYLLPHELPDGSASYCEVAAAQVPPEELGKEFGIPTYFLISMSFPPASR